MSRHRSRDSHLCWKKRRHSLIVAGIVNVLFGYSSPQLLTSSHVSPSNQVRAVHVRHVEVMTVTKQFYVHPSPDDRLKLPVQGPWDH